MIAVIVFLLGLAVGSFLNVWMWRNRPHPVPLLSRRGGCPSGAEPEPVAHPSRRPKGAGHPLQPPLPAGEGWGEGKSVWHGRSYCPQCKKTLRWYELIPLLSFIVQRGRCRGCRQKIDWQYPLVEMATGVLFLFGFWSLDIGNSLEIRNWKLGIELLVSCYLLSALVILFVYDLRFGLVPDRVVLPAIAVAFIAHAPKLSFVQRSVQSLALIGLAIAVGAAFFATQYYLSKGRWLGEGDIRIGALMGAMLGWPHVISGLVVSYMIGGTVGILLLAGGRKKFGQTLPLGTFLTPGTVIIFLYGEQIWKWYWR